MIHPLYTDLCSKLDHLTQMVQELKKAQKVYLTLSDAAEYLGISKSTLYKHTSSGDIPYNKPNGKLILFNRADLDNWISKLRIPSKYEL